MTIDPRLKRIIATQPYPLLFATISGAHLYGFPSPDSDFDLRGAHVLPLTSPRPSPHQMRRGRAAWMSAMKPPRTRAPSKGWLAEPKPEVMLSPRPLLSYGATTFARTEAVGGG